MNSTMSRPQSKMKNVVGSILLVVLGALLAKYFVPSRVTIPTVVNLNVTQADVMLHSLGLRTSTTSVEGGTFGTVIAQSPVAGSIADSGAEVLLVEQVGPVKVDHRDKTAPSTSHHDAIMIPRQTPIAIDLHDDIVVDAASRTYYRGSLHDSVIVNNTVLATKDSDVFLSCSSTMESGYPTATLTIEGFQPANGKFQSLPSTTVTFDNAQKIAAYRAYLIACVIFGLLCFASFLVAFTDFGCLTVCAFFICLACLGGAVSSYQQARILTIPAGSTLHFQTDADVPVLVSEANRFGPKSLRLISVSRV